MLFNLLQRVPQLIEHLVEQLVTDIERGLDTDCTGAEKRARDEHPAFEQGRRHAIANEAVGEFETDEQSFAADLLEDVRV